MKHVRILQEISTQNWAIGEHQMRSMLSILSGDLPLGQYDFYLNAPPEMKSIKALFGNPVDGTRFATKIKNTGILTIYGPLIPRASMLELSGATSISDLSNDFGALENDDDIENILLVVDSPGGSVTGVSEFATQIYNSSKNVVSLVVGMGASAAYWLVSQSDELYAVDTAEIGAIGTVVTIVDYSQANEKDGIKEFDIVSSQTPRKRTDLTTEEGRTELQALLDDITDVFIAAVAAGRVKSADEVLDKFGKGATFAAREALERGMVDAITTTEDIIKNLTGAKPLTEIPSQVAENKNQPLEVKTMGDENQNTQDAAQPEDLENVKIEAAAEAVLRIKAIEAIVGDYKDYSSEVIDAVKVCIDENKFDTKLTVDDARSLAKDAALAAQNDIITRTRTTRNRLAADISIVPDEPVNEPRGDDEVDPKRVASMVAGFNRYNGVQK